MLISLIFLPFLTSGTQAQDFQINFTGIGASTTVDSVKVENLNQGNSLSLGGHDTLHLLANVGITEIITGAANGILVYPNPMNGVCTIEFETLYPGRAIISLCNIDGKTILQEQEFLPEGNHSYGLSGLSRGIYFIRVESDKYSYTAKLMSVVEISGSSGLKHLKTTTTAGRQFLNSPPRETMRMKNLKTRIELTYTSGDILKFTGKSGIYRTLVMLVPAGSQTVSFNFVSCTDADNNNYSVVQIGTQFWMAENLKTTKYRNGDNIPNVTGNTAWGNLTTGAYSWYNNDASAYKITYGGLYNWYAANDTRNLAPSGWHVPTDEEWTVLTTHLGGAATSGGKVKETGYAHWKNPNSRATNETGFTALPGGYRFLDGTFDENGTWSVWWCSTSSSTGRAPTRAVFYNYIDIGRDISDKKDGFALRCIKD